MKTRREILAGGTAVAITGTFVASVTALSASTDHAIPIAPSEWDYRSIKELSEALQMRKLSAVELVNHTIARIEALDQQINAVVVRDFERARAAAKAADVALARGERRPLLGVPITIKESFNVAGLPTSFGVPKFKDFMPKEDAVLVARARSAGAVILGKTNIPMMLADNQSYNDIYGTTNNPWDLRCAPGGSSGGSAAALAAGFGPLSFGSDLGGSLRAPAHYCGVYAHKPTLGLVPDRGQSPPPLPPLVRDPDLSVVGPMAIRAADLAVALDVVAGPDEERDGVGYRLALPPSRHDSLKDFRVLVIETNPLIPTEAVISSAIDRLSERLAGVGVKVARTSSQLPDLAESGRLWVRVLWSRLAALVPPTLYDQMLATASSLAPDDNSLAAERARGAAMSFRDYDLARNIRARLQQQWSLLFREYDVVLCPVISTVAFPHDHRPPAERRIVIDGKQYGGVDPVWAGNATMLGFPATVAPIDRSPTGLPIGVQIIGPYLEDRTTIAFAEFLEREFGGFMPPPGYAGTG